MNMVDGQIRPLALKNDAIAPAFASLPREIFVEKAFRGIAHCDDAAPVGSGRFLIAPHLLARMIDAANIAPTATVLDVGCASGYATAVLSRLAGCVIGVEENATLARAAGTNLASLGIDNAAALCARMDMGCPAEAPFDAILVSGGDIAALPAPLMDQLAQNGRLVAISAGRLIVATRRGDDISEISCGDAAAPSLSIVPNIIPGQHSPEIHP